MFDAVNNDGIAKILAAVPEFEPCFQEELRDEDGELGAIHAMSIFAHWVGERVKVRGPDDVTQRAFQAVEDLIADRSINAGNELAAEFIEALASDSDARALMGPEARERASAWE